MRYYLKGRVMVSNQPLQSNQLAHPNCFLKYFLIVFAVLIVLLSFAGNAYAAGGNFGGGDGTSSDPFIIEDEADLAAISLHLYSYFILGEDIILTSPWKPITGWFMGSLDGKGHTIFNLEIAFPKENGIGLFHVTNDASITNLTLESVNVKGNGVVGAVVGMSMDTTFDNIAVINGNVEGGDGSNVGGFVGLMDGGSISNSFFSGVVNGAYDVGGLAGSSDDTIVSNSFVTGDVTGENAVGGLIGDMWGGSVSNSFVTGDVTGEDMVGGLIGDMWGGSISNSFAAGDVTGENMTGGLVGNMRSGYVFYSYATGDVTGEDMVGGLIGRMGSGSISNSMALNDFVSGSADSSNVHRVIGLIGGSAETSNLYVWNNISVNGNIGVDNEISGAAEVTSEEVWRSYPSNSIWSAFTEDYWVLNSYGKFLLPVQIWNTDSTLGYAYVIADATHLIPKYSIIYDGNLHTAGDVPVDLKIYKLDEEATILGPGNLEKTGYTFIGWKTSPPEESYQPEDVRIMTSDIVLFARWQLNESTGGSGGGGTGTGNAVVTDPPAGGGNETPPPVIPEIPPPVIPEIPEIPDKPEEIAKTIILLFMTAVAAFAYRKVEETKGKK